MLGIRLNSPSKYVKRLPHGSKERNTLLTFKGNLRSAVFQVDGYIIKTGVKCDKLVMVQTSAEPEEAWTQIFVELKGHDAIHGMKQLLATANNPTFDSFSNRQRKARLVATSFPTNKANPKVEKLKIEFAKLNVDYKNIKSGQTDCL